MNTFMAITFENYFKAMLLDSYIQHHHIDVALCKVLVKFKTIILFIHHIFNQF